MNNTLIYCNWQSFLLLQLVDESETIKPNRTQLSVHNRQIIEYWLIQFSVVLLYKQIWARISHKAVYKQENWIQWWSARIACNVRHYPPHRHFWTSEEIYFWDILITTTFMFIDNINSMQNISR